MEKEMKEFIEELKERGMEVEVRPIRSRLWYTMWIWGLLSLAYLVMDVLWLAIGIPINWEFQFGALTITPFVAYLGTSIQE